jgi:hypothetical protein
LQHGVDELYADRAFADSGGDAFDARGADVADGEDGGAGGRRRPRSPPRRRTRVTRGGWRRSRRRRLRSGGARGAGACGSLAGDAGGEPEVVFDLRAGPRLAAGGAGLEDQHVETFGGGVDRGGEAGGSGADDHQVADGAGVEGVVQPRQSASASLLGLRRTWVRRQMTMGAPGRTGRRRGRRAGACPRSRCARSARRSSEGTSARDARRSHHPCGHRSHPVCHARAVVCVPPGNKRWLL